MQQVLGREWHATMACMSEDAARVMSTDCSSCGTSFAACDALAGRRACCLDCAVARGRIHEPGVRLKRPEGPTSQPARRGVELVLVIRVVAAAILVALVVGWLFH